MRTICAPAAFWRGGIRFCQVRRPAARAPGRQARTSAGAPIPLGADKRPGPRAYCSEKYAPTAAPARRQYLRTTARTICAPAGSWRVHGALTLVFSALFIGAVPTNSRTNRHHFGEVVGIQRQQRGQSIGVHFGCKCNPFGWRRRCSQVRIRPTHSRADSGQRLEFPLIVFKRRADLAVSFATHRARARRGSRNPPQYPCPTATASGAPAAVWSVLRPIPGAAARWGQRGRRRLCWAQSNLLPQKATRPRAWTL